MALATYLAGTEARIGQLLGPTSQGKRLPVMTGSLRTEARIGQLLGKKATGWDSPSVAHIIRSRAKEREKIRMRILSTSER